MIYTHRKAEKLNEKLHPFEQRYDILLDKGKNYILRLDGVNMTKNFLGKKDVRSLFLKTMRQTMQLLFNQEPKLKFAYSYSDEISILLEESVLNDYDYRLEKIVSIYTSKITAAFYLAASKNQLPLYDRLRSFDGRIIGLDERQLKDYFVSRQAFAISSHLIRLKNQHLPDLPSTNSKKIIATLKEKGIIYEEIPKEERYGLLWVNDGFQMPYEFKAFEGRFYFQLNQRQNYHRKQRKGKLQCSK